MSTSRSRTRSSRSRPRASRNPSVSSMPYVPQPEGLVLPDGPVGEQATELLQELIHTHREEPTLVGSENDLPDTGSESEEEEPEWRSKLPWWRRPSVWWLMIATPLTATAMSSTLAPKIEVYTMLACNVHRPEYTSHLDLRHLNIPYNPPQDILPPSTESSSPYVDFGNIKSNDTSIYLTPSLLATPEKDPPKGNTCATDPVVQAAVAKISTLMTASMGVLGCLTTSWWGSLSDRRGRTRVMGLTILGLIFADVNFIFVSLNARKLPGNYWFLLVGPVVEGCLGGYTSGVAAAHAYLADCVDSTARTRTFSLQVGLLFTGMAFGPTIGGLLIRATSNVLSVFYFATGVHILYALLAWVILPESLSKKQMRDSRIRHKQEIERELAERDTSIAVGLLVRLKRLFRFLSPLTVLAPVAVPQANPLKKRKLDWSLTFTVACFGCVIMIMGSYPFKFQYAASMFGWTSETLGYFITLAGVVRAAYLTVILPLIIKLVRRKPAVQLPVESEEPLNAPSAEPSTSTSTQTEPAKPTRQPTHSASFDLNLARVSLLVEVVAYFLLALAPTPGLFVGLTMLGSLGAGFSPAIQSVAVELYTRRGDTEIGKLFGAISVIQVISMQVIGPAIFGLLYMKTVATVPQSIFFLSVALVTLSFILSLLVRVGKEDAESAAGDVEEAADDARVGREETLINTDEGGSDESGGRANKGKVPKLIVTEVDSDGDA